MDTYTQLHSSHCINRYFMIVLHIRTIPVVYREESKQRKYTIFVALPLCFNISKYCTAKRGFLILGKEL